MYKKLAILIIVISAVVFFVASQKPSSAQTPTTINYWSASAPFPGSSHPMPSFIAGDYYYVLLTDRRIVYAKIKTDGSLDSWQIATAQHGEGDGRGFAVVVVNNIPYSLRFGRSEKFNIDSSGNVTEITQVGPEDRIGGNYYYWNSAITAVFDTSRYVFNLGGFDCCEGAHYSTNNLTFRSTASTTPWQWQAMGEGPYQNPYKAAFYRPEGADYGYIYVGNLHKEMSFNPNYPDQLYRVKVKNDGTFDTGWTLTASLPQKATADPHSFGEIFVSGSTLFVIRGRKVYSANIIDHGALTAWSDTPADLPDTQIEKNWGPSQDADHTDGNSVGIKNNFVYITGKDKVYFTQFGGTGPSTSPNPSITGPAPTLAPCPTTLVKDGHIKFFFQSDEIKDIGEFNDSGGLTIVAKNTTRACKLTVTNISIDQTEGSSEYTTANFVDLPSGENALFIRAPRSIRGQFNSINLTASENLDCTVTSPDQKCGDLGNAEKRTQKKLYSGNANDDNIINMVDFELYRRCVGSEIFAPNADFDYNGTVEYKDGTGDDFAVFKTNFGKKGD